MYDKASLVQIPSGYKSGTLYSVVPNTDVGDFTVTGDPEGEATRVNKDGLIETVAADVPRLNYDPSNPQDPHLLLEPQRTNECLYSETLSSWSELNGGSLQTITDNDAIAPDGSLTASTITFTGTGTSLLRQFSNKAYTSNKHSSSFYAKKISGSGSVFFGITDTETEFTPTDEWVRYEVNNVTPTDFGSNLFLDLNFDCSEGDKIAVWGMQLEEGTYSTSVIETGGSAVTRTEDNAQIASGAEDIIGSQNEGTLFIDLEIPYDTTSSDYFQFCISDGATTDNRVLMNFRSGEAIFQVFSGGSSVGFCNTPVVKNTRIKVAASYKTNEFILYKDGTLADTIDTSGVVDFTTQMETIRYADFGNGLKFEAKVHQTMFFKEALSESELQALTT